VKVKLRAVNIDGLDGIGKSTQTNVLAVHLNKNNIPYKIIQLEDNLENITKCLQQTKDFLLLNPSGIVISDGSIAKAMVLELIAGISQPIIVEKYRKVIHEYECLAHQYGMANLLLVSTDIDMCQRRIEKREKLLGNHIEKNTNHSHENHVIRLLRTFDSHTLSRSLKFNVINIEENNSILDVHRLIVDSLKANFDGLPK
jgi:thymidylate kinase